MTSWRETGSEIGAATTTRARLINWVIAADGSPSWMRSKVRRVVGNRVCTTLRPSATSHFEGTWASHGEVSVPVPWKGSIGDDRQTFTDRNTQPIGRP